MYLNSEARIIKLQEDVVEENLPDSVLGKNNKRKSLILKCINPSNDWTGKICLLYISSTNAMEVVNHYLTGFSTHSAKSNPFLVFLNRPKTCDWLSHRS